MTTRLISSLVRVTALIFLMNTATNAGAPGQLPEGWSERYTYANGIRLHYYRAVPAPGKPVIVMVHGVTDIGLSWATLTEKLQGSYDIYMLDTRGHGLSDPFTSADDGNTLVKDVAEFVRVMNFEKPILMGHSMGAATVMRLGAEYPDLAKAIIMLDPFLGPITPQKENTQASAPKNQNKKDDVNKPKDVSVSMRGTPETLVRQNNYDFADLYNACRTSSPKWDSVDCHYWALSKKQYHGAYTAEAWQAMFGTMKTGESLGKIPVQSLILKADASPEQRQANEKFVRSMPRVQLVHLSGTGHNLHHDDLATTVRILSEFLSKL